MYKRYLPRREFLTLSASAAVMPSVAMSRSSIPDYVVDAAFVSANSIYNAADVSGCDAQFSALPLRGAERDYSKVSNALNEIGIDVPIKDTINLTREKFLQELIAFREYCLIRKPRAILFYFSGHGLAIQEDGFSGNCVINTDFFTCNKVLFDQSKALETPHNYTLIDEVIRVLRAPAEEIPLLSRDPSKFLSSLTSRSFFVDVEDETPLVLIIDACREIKAKEVSLRGGEITEVLSPPVQLSVAQRNIAYLLAASPGSFSIEKDDSGSYFSEALEESIKMRRQFMEMVAIMQRRLAMTLREAGKDDAKVNQQIPWVQSSMSGRLWVAGRYPSFN